MGYSFHEVIWEGRRDKRCGRLFQNSVDLGKKFSNDSAISKQFMEIEKSNGKLYCELKITDREGNKNSYTIELELTKVTK